MKTHRETLWLWRSFALVGCSLPASACVDALVGEIDVCDVDGKSYKLNEKFPASDGCNTCTCKIDGDVECTEIACDSSPVVCDEKLPCATDAGVILPTPDCDPKYGCDASSLPYCVYLGVVFPLGESFKAKDGCNTCSCEGVGIQCSDNVCYEPDGSVGPGTCEYASTLYKPGESFLASDNCNKCRCTDSSVVECTRVNCPNSAGTITSVGDAGGACGQFSCPSGNGSCTYMGNTYSVGEGFAHRDGCNKCSCVADGSVECTSFSCSPTGCSLGNGKLINFGQSVTCEDGCNTCTCDMKGMLSRTTRACSALPFATSCDAAMNPLAFPAPLVYVSGDAVGVSESRCVNGQSNEFTLCFDALSASSYEVGLYVVPSGVTHACVGSERVFSLGLLREAYTSATGQMSGKLGLRGNQDVLGYAFGF